MRLKKKEAKIVDKAIDRWEEEEMLDAKTARKLRDSYAVKSFDWQRLAKYTFWAAIACFIIAVGALMADELIQEALSYVFSSEAFSATALALVAAGIFYYGYDRAQRYPEKIYSTEAIYALGAIFTAGAIAFFGMAVPTDSNDPSSLILLASVIYGGVGIVLPSTVLWVACLLALGSWFGARTGYHYGAYFLGMNYPLRFVVFGSVLTAVSFFLQKTDRVSQFSKHTYIIGLLYLFVSLWIMSIFGNYSDADMWYDASHLELLHWSILFAGVAIGAIIYGLKNGDAISRKFGLTFLFINLYTKFFELFWDTFHKAIVFGILGLSLWLIGRKAESIWELKFLQEDASPSQS